MNAHLGFVEEVLFGDLSYGVQVGTTVFSHNGSPPSVGPALRTDR